MIRILDFASRDAVGQRRGAEPAEDHRMHRADSRAGQHGDRQFGNHRHVDRHAIARLHSERFQGVREPANALVQFGIGELQGRAVLRFPKQRRLVGILFEMAVKAVVGHVELAADEPFGVGQVPIERLLGRLEPVEHLGLLRPKCLGFACARSYSLRYSARATSHARAC